MEKDTKIVELLDSLRKHLGSRFTVTDRWEADLFAVGISAPGDPAQLVYIQGHGQPKGRYSVELESASLTGSEIPYQTVSNFDSVNRGELLEIVTKHLGISK